MMQANERAPARILKRRDVAATSDAAAPSARGAVPASNAPLPQRCASKTARLVASASGRAAVEVRCSCGELTRVEIVLDSAAGGEAQR